jgi:hypothetical protein
MSVSPVIMRQRMKTAVALIFCATLTGGMPEVHASDCPLGSEGYAAYQQDLLFQRFSHPRLGATTCYPVTLFPTVEPTPDGFRFASDDGLSWFTLTHDVLDGHRPIRSMMDQAERDLLARSASITYSRIKDNWFVLSGHTGDRIYYMRTVVDGAALATDTLHISIPVEQKTFYYDIITRMSRSFRLR